MNGFSWKRMLLSRRFPSRLSRMILIGGISLLVFILLNPGRNRSFQPPEETFAKTTPFQFPATGGQSGIPAFPGAEGAGALSVGGRGARIIEVTNLNDS